MDTRLLLDVIYLISGKGFVITMELNFARFTKIIIILPGTMAASEEILEAILFYHNRFVLFISRGFYIPFLNYYRYQN